MATWQIVLSLFGLFIILAVWGVRDVWAGYADIGDDYYHDDQEETEPIDT